MAVTRPGFIALGTLVCLSVPALSASFSAPLHRCPQSCSELSSSSLSWTSYHSLARLDSCNETVLFDTNIFHDVDTYSSVRACSVQEQNAFVADETSCDSAVTTSVSMQMVSWKSTSSASQTSDSISRAVNAVQNHVSAASNCGEPLITFSRDDDTIVGVYMGSRVDSVTATEASVNMINATSTAADVLVVQSCGSGLDASDTFGIIIGNAGGFDTVQAALQTWANATCLAGYDASTATNTTVGIIPTRVSTADGGDTSASAVVKPRDDACSYVQVVSGDSCASLADECGITSAELYEYNTASDLCSTLAIGEVICCSAGTAPDLSPQENADGTCASYTVQSGDYCALVASDHYITVDDIEDWNAETWGWSGCDNLQLGAVICLSTGDPPMPAVLAGAECGPQVNGTARPADWADISSLNPCPLNACCDIWGECGITPEFCTATESTTGAPGTAAAGTNGCISNCGTDIVNNDAAPGEFYSIGYFESFGADRSCLNMDASLIPSSYTHLHYAFGEISDNYEVNVSANLGQFEIFANITHSKRILSFGGWSFSTDADTYPIFREGVTDANRLAFADSIVSFVDEYNLDGVDFDWEYPGATDIPGVPEGSADDGANYLEFLQTLRSVLPDDKSISIAAPASYWYLKGFPIADISDVVDYIVYMTYDLHGQWDYDNAYANPGCPTGNCLRSHVNLTETEYALSMITKAGVPASRVVVGIASYGRSFGMQDPSCTGPGCFFTGPDSTAAVGDCTATAGYISLAELEQYNGSSTTGGVLSRRAVTSWYDDDSASDMMVYDDGTWVAYMSQDTKNARVQLYSGYNFGGSVEWAIDLATFTESVDDEVASLDVEALETDFETGLTLSGYDTSEFTTYNLSDLATRLIGWEGCTTARGMPRAVVYSGWQQSWKLMNRMKEEANGGMDFNSAAAIEYLGPPALNQGQQAAFNDIFLNLASIQPGYITTPFDWRIHVRCDDPAQKCPCGSQNGPVAYTVNRAADDGLPRINFCPKYFARDTLDTVMKNADLNQAVEVYADMNKYQANQGATWFHELLHIDWVSLSNSYGYNNEIIDIRVEFQRATGGTSWVTAYGPIGTKLLARWGISTGWWIIQNAESFTMYAIAKLVQYKIGIYPHLPLAPRAPTDVSKTDTDEEGDTEITDLFTMLSNGTVEMDANVTAYDELEWSPTAGVCGVLDDEDEANDDSQILTLSAAFAEESVFPTDYLSSWSSWAGLSPTTTTTSAAASATATWSIAIYSEADCAGDYYSLDGHNLESSSETCLVLRGGDLTTDVSTSDVSCRWFTDGGFQWDDCSSSDLTQPLSWRVVGGVCTAFDNDQCAADGAEDAYIPGQGCHNYSADADDAQTWIALHCGAERSLEGRLLAAAVGGTTSVASAGATTTTTTPLSTGTSSSSSSRAGSPTTSSPLRTTLSTTRAVTQTASP